ncbi:MAG: HAD hydrolase-like protein [Patescibacteria group bacterium]
MKSETSPLRGWFSLMKIIFDYNRTIFDPEKDRLYDGAFEVLKTLAMNNDLFLVSRNEPKRETRLKSLGIIGLFKKILFIGEKSEDSFLSFVGEDRDVIVVGDSVQDEIRIGNKLGFTTIRILQGKFRDITPTSIEEISDYEIKDIREVINIVKNYEK